MQMPKTVSKGRLASSTEYLVVVLQEPHLLKPFLVATRVQGTATMLV